MSETMQIVIGFILLAGVYILTRYGMALRIKQASISIIKDLERKKAIDASSATELPYAKSSLFRIGLRDYRPKAIESMIHGDIVGMTPDGKYYLKMRPHNLQM
jgi:hypothetical protein